MRERARRRGPRTAGPSLSGLLAGVAVLVLAIVLLLLDSTVSEVARFVLFTGLGIALPGLVRWLYADNRAGKVSTALRNYVQLRHATTDATIYELK